MAVNEKSFAHWTALCLSMENRPKRFHLSSDKADKSWTSHLQLPKKQSQNQFRSRRLQKQSNCNWPSLPDISETKCLLCLLDYFSLQEISEAECCQGIHLSDWLEWSFTQKSQGNLVDRSLHKEAVSKTNNYQKHCCLDNWCLSERFSKYFFLELHACVVSGIGRDSCAAQLVTHIWSLKEGYTVCYRTGSGRIWLQSNHQRKYSNLTRSGRKVRWPDYFFRNRSDAGLQQHHGAGVPWGPCR